MSFSNGPKGIVTDGIVFAADAGNTQCWNPNASTSGSFNNLANPTTGSLMNDTSGSLGPGGSFIFDGTNDFIDCGNNSIFQITGDITLSGWVYLDSYATNNDHIIGKENSYILKANQNSTSRPRFQLHDGSFKTLQGSAQLSLSTWHNVVGVKGDDVMRLYIDGVDIGSTTAYTGTTTSNSNNVYISGYDGSGAYDSDGNMANLYIYNKALTAAEVLQNYNSQKTRFGL